MCVWITGESSSDPPEHSNYVINQLISAFQASHLLTPENTHTSFVQLVLLIMGYST